MKPKHIKDFFDLLFAEGLSRNTAKHYRTKSDSGYRTLHLFDFIADLLNTYI